MDNRYILIDGVGGPNKVGDLYGGGIIVYAKDGHGLIMSLEVSPTGLSFLDLTGYTIGTDKWDGSGNTVKLLSQTGMTSSAAGWATGYTNSDFGTGVYSDWYLPAIFELSNIIPNCYYLQKTLTLNNYPIFEDSSGSILGSSSEWVTINNQWNHCLYTYDMSLGTIGKTWSSQSKIRAFRQF